MKLLPVMLASAGLLAAACGTAPAGSLGPAPAGSSQPPSSASPTASGSASPAQPPSGQPSGQPSTAPTSSAPAPAREIGLQVWFTRNGKLFVTKRSVPVTTGVAAAAVDGMLAGPSAQERAAGLRSQIPAGTTLLGVHIAGRIATVDLSPSFESAASQPTMALRIAQLVYTVTQFPTVTGVRFAISGQGVTVLGGIPVQSPQTRAMDSGYLPAITVQSPVIGEQVTSPVTLSGTADVFEATVSIRILDSAGREIARTFTTASCGTGCRGDYSAAVRYSVPRTEPGTVEVFESSAKDGRPVKVQLIPVILAP